MKTLILTILFSIFLYGCGENNPVNNGNPPPVSNDSLILSIDSLSIRGIGYQFLDSMLYLPLDSFKVTFTSSTNCTNDDNLVVISIGGNGYIYLQIQNATALNTSHIARFRIREQPGQLIFGLKFQSNFIRYLKLYNIKIYIVH